MLICFSRCLSFTGRVTIEVISIGSSNWWLHPPCGSRDLRLSGSDPLSTAMDRMKKVKKCLQPPGSGGLQGICFYCISLDSTIQWK